MGKKVFVGLSGGVDSAVSAALLKEKGNDVVGAFIKIWQPEFIECTWAEDRLDAMRVCAALEIPFKEIDLSHEYKEAVIRDMVERYAKGITPNPDVLCNSVIKFGAFARWAHSEGAEFLATGHYAQIVKKDSRYELHRGSDMNKDQSYFLWQLTSSDLERIVFPVGTMKKSAVREHASRFNLPVKKKPDSQGLCFVGNITIAEFLGNYISVTPGDVVDENGNVIGTHNGSPLYTLGQRHGFSLQTGRGHVWYVVKVDTKANTLTVSENRANASRSHIPLEGVHWFSDPALVFPVSAQLRYREEPVATEPITMNDTMLRLKNPGIIAPGQSIVFYDANRVLGGAIAG